MSKAGKIVALVVAAGSGTRAGGEVPKQYRRLGGKAVLAHAVDHLRRAGANDIRVVIGSGQEALYEEAIVGRALPDPIVGGAERRQSVLNGLEAIAANGGADIVLVHDAARPFVYLEVWQRLIAALEDSDLAVPALPGVDTIVRGRPAGDWTELGDPVDRSGLYRVQTPQACRFEAI